VNPAAAQIARASEYSVYGSVAEIPADAAYDAIVSNHVFEHVRDVAGTLEQLRTRLKPGGLLITKLPIDDWRNPQQHIWSADDVDHHLHTWTPRLFANVLFEAGYEVREAKVICSAWHPKLFPLVKLGLGGLAFRALAVIKRRRQLLAVGMRKD
jgi:SAM-dependent methyltransferase